MTAIALGSGTAPLPIPSAAAELGLPDQEVVAIDIAVDVGIAICLRRVPIGKLIEAALPNEEVVPIDRAIFVEVTLVEATSYVSVSNNRQIEQARIGAKTRDDVLDTRIGVERFPQVNRLSVG